MRAKCVILGSLLSLLAFFQVGCGQGRKEARFGFFTDRTILSSRTMLLNDKLRDRVTRIGNNIAKIIDKPDISFTFRVVNDPTINAYSAAGGFVYLNTGLLDFLESEDELAVIMAHEIGHIVDRHQVKFQQSVHDKKVMGVMGGAMLGAALGVAGAQALGSAPPPSSSAYAMHQQATSQMLGLGLDAGMALGNLTAVSMIKGYGKKLELRADSLAIQYAHASNYDPNALVDVFNRLASIRDRLRLNENNYVSNLINAEPGLEERIEEAERLISEAG